MKRSFSLLEVSIGLTLTAILLICLFSSFRHLMKTGVQVETARAEVHGEHLLDLRLTRIFESLTRKIYTAPHDQALGDALYFIFDNGLDPDPEYCGEIRGALFASNEKDSSICLQLKNKREEIFVKGVNHFSIEAFYPNTAQWQSHWKHGHFPPMIRINIDQKTYSYIIPKTLQKVVYKQ